MSLCRKHPHVCREPRSFSSSLKSMQDARLTQPGQEAARRAPARGQQGRPQAPGSPAEQDRTGPRRVRGPTSPFFPKRNLALRFPVGAPRGRAWEQPERPPRAGMQALAQAQARKGSATCGGSSQWGARGARDRPPRRRGQAGFPEAPCPRPRACGQEARAWPRLSSSCCEVVVRPR